MLKKTISRFKPGNAPASTSHPPKIFFSSTQHDEIFRREVSVIEQDCNVGGTIHLIFQSQKETAYMETNKPFTNANEVEATCAGGPDESRASSIEFRAGGPDESRTKAEGASADQYKEDAARAGGPDESRSPKQS
jgi:hypothetical protein